MEPLFVLFFAVVVAFSIYGTWARAQRRRDFEAVALQHGLDHSVEDPFDCTRVSFPLFRKGAGRGAENVMWRNGVNECPVRAFDYWYYTESRDQNGNVSKTYHYFSCAMAQVNGAWPELQVEREGVLDRVAGALGFDDIDFESEEFNRTYAVHCQDRRFAMALIDPRMMEHLLATRGRVAYALKGRWLLLSCDRVKPSLMPALMKLADGFVEHIPSVVWDLYPTPFVDEEGKPLPAPDELSRAAPEERDPFDALLMSPFEALHPKPGGPQYDLDGNVLPEVEQDPWDEIPGGPETRS